MLSAADVADIHPHSMIDGKGRPTRTIMVEPFPADGFSKSGIYIQIGGGTTACPNCKATPGIAFRMDGWPGECWRCNGAGTITMGQLYPVWGRVLAVAPDCIWLEPGDVVHFRPNAYDDVRTADGRTLCFMRESSCEAVIEGYDDFEIAR